jgi:hypothetical protein
MFPVSIISCFLCHLSHVHFCRRAWHQAHVPSATMRLVSYYLPLNSTLSLDIPTEQAPRGSTTYYLQCIGGSSGLAQLYLEAGLLYIEGAATTLLSSSFSNLSSIRLPLHAQVGESGTEAWKRDRETAARLFERAQKLQPSLEIPNLPHEKIQNFGSEELEMPSMKLETSAPRSARSGESNQTDPDTPMVRRRRKKEELTLFDNHINDDVDNTWYVYIPGLVGAGTALLAVGIIGVLSFSTWSRRNQGS